VELADLRRLAGDEALETASSLELPRRERLLEVGHAPADLHIHAGKVLFAKDLGASIHAPVSLLARFARLTSMARSKALLATSKEKELAHKGTIVTFSVVRVPSQNIDVPLPYCGANILLDGADISLTALIQECDFEDVKIGMRVEAVWRPESEWDYTLSNIKYFRPTGEPDVPFDEIKGYS
jgi:hypothetical protein